MTIITQTLPALFYSAAISISVIVASYNWGEIERSRIHGDLIRAQYEQAANIEIAKLAQDTIISEHAVKIAEHYEAIASHQEVLTGHKAIAKVWGCR